MADVLTPDGVWSAIWREGANGPDLAALARALAQAHADGRAEGLEAAARLFEAKAAELRKSNYPPTHLAAYEYDDHADRIRALAGQPSGDAKGK